MCGQQNDPRKSHHAVVKSDDAFQVEMVSRLVQHQHIGILQHHLADHAAHFFTPAQYVGLL